MRHHHGMAGAMSTFNNRNILSTFSRDLVKHNQRITATEYTAWPCLTEHRKKILELSGKKVDVRRMSSTSYFVIDQVSEWTVVDAKTFDKSYIIRNGVNGVFTCIRK